MRISALILTKDVEDMIDGCLSQLDFVDEIIVLDQYSTDNTVNIVKKYTNNIMSTKNTEFDKNRNILAEKAKYDWLLYVDSDERYSKELISEIKNSTKDNIISEYYIPRKNMVLGKWMKHGGFWPDYVPKLFYKNNLKHWKGSVHESPVTTGRSANLKTSIKHLTARSLNQMMEKTITWAEVEAKLAYKANHPKVNLFKVIKTFVVEFFKVYLYKMGFLDGVVGLIQSLFQGYHRAISLVYLWELQNNSKENFLKSINV